MWIYSDCSAVVSSSPVVCNVKLMGTNEDVWCPDAWYCGAVWLSSFSLLWCRLGGNLQLNVEGLNPQWDSKHLTDSTNWLIELNGAF